jgi:transcriptional regulator GlxA family with amidase domain
MRIALLAYDGCLASSVTGPLDLFGIAGKLAALRPRKGRRLVPAVCSLAGGTIRTSSGMSLATQALGSMHYDHVFLAAADHSSPGDLVRQLGSLSAVSRALGAIAGRGVPIAAACSGAFLLAESGALDGRRATTSWWLAATFRKRYPAVRLQPEQIIVQDGPVLTAGAVTSCFDLALRIAERCHGRALAGQVARVMLIDPTRQSQAPYVMSALLERPRTGAVERANRWLQRHLEEPFEIADLAQHCRVSVRTLLRRFREAHGTTPVRYVQGLRVERAKALLETTRLSFEEIVERCGYRDASAFRKLFTTVARATPREYQKRFRLRRVAG